MSEGGIGWVAMLHDRLENIVDRSGYGSYFSGEDRARALFGDEPAYPDVTYVVVSDARTRGEVRAFRCSDEAHDFVEVAIEVREA